MLFLFSLSLLFDVVVFLVIAVVVAVLVGCCCSQRVLSDASVAPPGAIRTARGKLHPSEPG